MDTSERSGSDPSGVDRSAIDSRASFAAAVQAAIVAARDHGARRMVWADADFDAWPLNDPALLRTLTEWSRLPQRRLLLLARDFDRLRRDGPRFVGWRQTWAHAVEAFAPAPADVNEVPSLLLVESVVAVERLDTVRWRGRISTGAAELRSWSEEIDAFLQRCSPAFPASTLGL